MPLEFAELGSFTTTPFTPLTVPPFILTVPKSLITYPALMSVDVLVNVPLSITSVPSAPTSKMEYGAEIVPPSSLSITVTVLLARIAKPILALELENVKVFPLRSITVPFAGDK